MSKLRKLLPITEYLMEHVYDKMWHYKNPERYLDRVLRKWEDGHNDLVELDYNILRDMSEEYHEIDGYDTYGFIKAICDKFGHRPTEESKDNVQ